MLATGGNLMSPTIKAGNPKQDQLRQSSTLIEDHITKDRYGNGELLDEDGCLYMRGKALIEYLS